MHWSKAEKLMRKINIDPLSLRKMPYTAAEQFVSYTCEKLLILYHPDTGNFKDAAPFREIREITNEIKEIGFKEILNALNTAPAKTAHIRTQLETAKLRNFRDKVAIDLTQLVEEFRSGQYFYELVHNTSETYVLLSNPSFYYPVKSIDLESVLEDKKATPFVVSTIRQTAKEKVSKLTQKNSDLVNALSSLELQKESIQNGLKAYASLENAFKSGSLQKIKSELISLKELYSNTEPVNENAAPIRISNLIPIITHYYKRLKKIPGEIEKKKNALIAAETSLQLIESQTSIASVQDFLRYDKSEVYSPLRGLIARKKKTENLNITSLQHDLSSKIEKIKEDIQYLESAMSEERAKNEVELKYLAKKDRVEETLDKIAKKIETALKEKISAEKTIKFLNSIDYSTLQENQKEIMRYTQELGISIDMIADTILNTGTDEQKKLISAREYIGKAFSVDKNEKPRYTGLVVLKIDKDLRISYKVLSSLADTLSHNTHKYTPTNKMLLGVINQPTVRTAGMPSDPATKMLSAPEGYSSDTSIISQEDMRKIKFFENLSNKAGSLEVASKYKLISIEFKDDHAPTYRAEGTVASDFFTDISSAKTKNSK
ncbi:MAG: hypothetical protein ACP5N3_05855 [Candidatus Nanoarchaeia archaeon]